jgi:phosphomannomutase
LKAYLEQERPDIKSAGVVLSYDGRHNSRRWARLAAGVFLRADIPVHLFETTTPTPFVPFTVVKAGFSIKFYFNMFNYNMTSVRLSNKKLMYGTRSSHRVLMWPKITSDFGV